MFIATPKLYFYNPAFRLKMILFFVAVIGAAGVVS